MEYQIPSSYDLDRICDEIINGTGIYIMRGAFSAADVAMSRERVLYNTNPYLHREDAALFIKDELHNNYKGMIWSLLNKGKIFEKMSQHPAVLEISRKLLGQNTQLSSFAANTVLPGMKGQLPHLDYPYYRHLWPDTADAMEKSPMLAIQFVTLLTKFTAENGGTGVRPHSHKLPSYPDNADDFYRNMIQLEGEPGDMAIFAGPVQHCAMTNNGDTYRTGILQHMVPIYVKSFEDIRVRDDVLQRATDNLRSILGVDHPYPVYKGETALLTR